jgi:predicted dehydrogenase
MHQYWYEGSNKATKTPVSVKIGVLSSAMINPAALFHPAASYAGAQVVAIASRDQGVAEKTAKSYNIPKSYDNYEALLADPEVEAVYISLPNGLHGGEQRQQQQQHRASLSL